MSKDDLLEQVFEQSYDKDILKVKPVYCPATNKVYLQTDPFIRDGKIIIKRLAEYDVTIEKSFQTITEYKMKQSIKHDS